MTNKGNESTWINIGGKFASNYRKNHKLFCAAPKSIGKPKQKNIRDEEGTDEDKIMDICKRYFQTIFTQGSIVKGRWFTRRKKQYKE